VNTFAVPDLRAGCRSIKARDPGLSNYVIGQRAGTETVTVLATQMPAHTHTLAATTGAAGAVTPVNTLLPGTVSGDSFYVSDVAGATALPMSPQSTSLAGGSQPHENCMPTLTVQFCIAWAGIFPSQG